MSRQSAEPEKLGNDEVGQGWITTGCRMACAHFGEQAIRQVLGISGWEIAMKRIVELS